MATSGESIRASALASDVGGEEKRSQEGFLGCGLEQMVVPISGMERMEKGQVGGRNVQSSLESTDTWETASRREWQPHHGPPGLGPRGDCRAWRRDESQDWMGDLWSLETGWAVKERE